MLRNSYAVLLALLALWGAILLTPGLDTAEQEMPAPAAMATSSATTPTTGSTSASAPRATDAAAPAPSPRATTEATPAPTPDVTRVAHFGLATTITTSVPAVASAVVTTVSAEASAAEAATASATTVWVPTSTTVQAPPSTSPPADGTTVYLPNGLVIRPFYRIVQATGTVHVLDAPGGAVIQTLSAKNEMGELTSLLVIEPATQSGPAVDPGAPADQEQPWYDVGLRIRPNGTTGWISADEVTEGLVTTVVVIELEAHRLTLYDRGSKIGTYPVGLGTTANPTPTGTFFVLGVDKHGAGSAYGPFAIGTSALSETLTDWPGGGMVGIHGTNKPGSVGENMSHGCIRMLNDDITVVAQAVRLGTPVFIVP